MKVPLTVQGLRDLLENLDPSTPVAIKVKIIGNDGHRVEMVDSFNSWEDVLFINGQDQKVLVLGY